MSSGIPLCNVQLYCHRAPGDGIYLYTAPGSTFPIIPVSNHPQPLIASLQQQPAHSKSLTLLVSSQTLNLGEAAPAQAWPAINPHPG